MCWIWKIIGNAKYISMNNMLAWFGERLWTFLSIFNLIDTLPIFVRVAKILLI